MSLSHWKRQIFNYRAFYSFLSVLLFVSFIFALVLIVVTVYEILGLAAHEDFKERCKNYASQRPGLEAIVGKDMNDKPYCIVWDGTRVTRVILPRRENDSP